MNPVTSALVVWRELWIVAVPLLVFVAVAGVTAVRRHCAPAPKPFVPAQRGGEQG